MRMIASILVTVSLVLWCTSGILLSVSGLTNPNDVQALRILVLTWGAGPGSPLRTWRGDDPCDLNWEGVKCEFEHTNRVTSLSLSGWNITGSGGIPAAIGDLTNLQTLHLSNTFLGGTIPKEIGKLINLRSLALQWCGITGSIPEELGNLVLLDFLALSGNQLSGTIPYSIGHLSNLIWFDLSDNQIEGPLPLASNSPDGLGLGNLTSAAHIDWNNNLISGELPDELFTLVTVSHLLLDSNAFTGVIPASVGLAKNLLILLLDSNAFTGVIPTSVSLSKNLLMLRLDNNQLDGTIPPVLSQVVTLTELNLRNNNLSGTLPDLSPLVNLQLLDVSNNNFLKQTLPDWWSQLTQLETLKAESANLVGSLHDGVLQLPLLERLSLRSNWFNGTLVIPENVGSALRTIDLQANNITNIVGCGQYCDVLLERPFELLLAANPVCSGNSSMIGPVICSVTEGFPAVYESTPLKAISCQRTCNADKVLNPDLCVCAFPLICQMQFTSVSFSTLDDARINAIGLELSRVYDLDDRQVYIASANFTVNNRLKFTAFFFPLTGDSLPQSKVQFIVASLTLNRVKLSEGPYILLSSLPPPIEPFLGMSGLSSAASVGITVGALFSAVIITVFGWYAFRQRRKAQTAIDPFAAWGGSKGNEGDAPKLKNVRAFSLSTITRAADNFHHQKMLGRGGYGKVYKGTLPSGQVVAIKRADPTCFQGGEAFKNEVELLTRLHHKNLVTLIGFVYKNKEQMLIYEYMPNGTLQDHLGPSKPSLPWKKRMSIALGSARGLHYLHELACPTIIHRDVKSSNILLDENMVAKVADFGLSKQGEEGSDTHDTLVKGSLGYLDPEYLQTYQLTEKSDVYSFGVVLLELITAAEVPSARNVVLEVRNAAQTGQLSALLPLLDPTLHDYDITQLQLCVDLALRCVSHSGVDRPTMGEVVRRLERLSPRSPSSRSSIVMDLDDDDLHNFLAL